MPSPRAPQVHLAQEEMREELGLAQGGTGATQELLGQGSGWAGGHQQQRLSVTLIINVSPLHFANNSRLSLSGDKWPL